MTRQSELNAVTEHHGDLVSRRADIQGLRALAVTLVILYHAGVPLSGGFTGVDMFFVVSGYVITESLLREYRARGRLRLGAFYLRRFKRLFPAMALMVSVVAVLGFLIIPPLTNNNQVTQTALGALTITANVVIAVATGDYFAREAHSNPLLHTWTLSVEEQFYLVFPLVLIAGLLAGRKAGSPRHAAGVAIAGVGGLSFLAAVLGSGLSLPFGAAIMGFYSPVTRAWEFAVGALLSLWGPEIARVTQGRLRHAIAGVGLAALVMSAVLITPDTPFPGVWTLLPVMGASLLIIAGSTDQPHFVAPALSWRPVVVIGDWSYSLYLWHWPLIVLATFQFGNSILVTAAAVGAAVLVAGASYRLIEQPLRRRLTPRKRDAAGFILGTLGVPVAVLGAGVVLTTWLFQPRLEAIIGRPFEESIGIDNRCLSDHRFDNEWAEKCTFGTSASGRPIVLIGDSTATHFDEGLVEAGRMLDRPVSIWTGVRCIPAFDFRLMKDDGDFDEKHCLSYRDFLTGQVSALPPSTLVLGLSDLTFYFPRSYYVDDTTGEVATDPVTKSEVLERALTATMVTLHEQGHDVLIVQAVPNFDQVGTGYSPESCTLSELVDDRCAPQVTEHEMDELQALHRKAIERAALAAGATLVDFRERFCIDGVCSPSRGGILTYLDATHLSAQESRELTPEWVRFLRE